jgi:hypothetical protein
MNLKIIIIIYFSPWKKNVILLLLGTKLHSVFTPKKWCIMLHCSFIAVCYSLWFITVFVDGVVVYSFVLYTVCLKYI